MPKRPAVPKRLAIARVSHEGNSFSPLLTGLREFERRAWVAGEAARGFYRGTRSELGAAVDFLDEHPGWDGAFMRCAAAPPGGPVESGLLRAIRDEILDGLAGQTWDGVYLSLHGAMIGPGRRRSISASCGSGACRPNAGRRPTCRPTVLEAAVSAVFHVRRRRRYRACAGAIP